MISKIHDIIVRPISFLFFFLGILIVFDYLLSPTTSEEVVINKLQKNQKGLDRVNKIYTNNYHDFYLITKDNKRNSKNSFSVLEEDYDFCKINDTLIYQKTTILGEKIRLAIKNHGKLYPIDVINIPFSNFPFYPTLLIIPIFFQYYKKDNMFILILKNMSFFLALFIAVLSLIY